jgi:FkbM family methyltransferase
LHRTLTAFGFKRALWRYAGLRDLHVAGGYGQIVGSIHDRAILERYAETGTWCPIENHMFMDFFVLHGGGTYLDIGANIGLTTIPIARNPRVVCFAFEPEPVNFAYLQENVRTNCPAGNVLLFKLALLDRAATLDLRISPTNKGDHRLLPGARFSTPSEEGWSVVQVEAKRLDDVAVDHQIVPPVAAKIVAQGSELHIVAGGGRILSTAELLMIEFYPYLLSRTEADWDLFYSFLAANFVRAALINGGQQAEPRWQPVADAIDRLMLLAQTASQRADLYFHVFFRK